MVTRAALPALLGLLIYALLLPKPVEAAVIVIDLLAPGDGLVTRDPDAGLDWLDVTETVGLSYEEVATGVGGWIDAGWRHATATEVCGLFLAVGGGPSPCPGWRYEPGDFGQPYLDLLGITQVVDWSDSYYLEQIWAYYDDETANPWVGVLELSVDHYSDGRVNTYIELRADADDPSSATYANLLVRPVPEPGTGLLLASGLVVCALGARRVRRSGL